MFHYTVRNLFFLLITITLLFYGAPLFAQSPYPERSPFKPDKLQLNTFAFVYGDISDLENTEDPYHSIRKLRNLPYLVCAEPGELSQESKLVTDTLKANTRIFGYVNLGPNNPGDPRNYWEMAAMDSVKGQIDNIARNGWYGVFIDQYGYDFLETRQRQNEIVDYAHEQGLKCFVNCWFPEDAMGTEIHPVSNPRGEPTHLQAGDLFLIESFLVDGSSYRGDLSYIDKYLQVKNYQDKLGIGIVVLSYKRDGVSWEDSSDDIVLSYLLSQCLNFYGWWFGGVEGDYNFSHLNPRYDIGEVLQPLRQVSGNHFRAESAYYTVEYYADEVPHLIAYPKRMDDPVITIRHSLPEDYIDLNSFSSAEALFTQKRLNVYGFADTNRKRLKEDGIFDDSSRVALNQFLNANGFIYYSQEAKDACLSQVNVGNFFFPCKFVFAFCFLQFILSLRIGNVLKVGHLFWVDISILTIF